MSAEEDCRLALELYAERLSELPNVQGVGVGERLAGGEPTGDFCVRVYVSKKIPLAELDEGAVIPSRLEVTDNSGAPKEVPVEVVEVGELKFG